MARRLEAWLLSHIGIYSAQTFPHHCHTFLVHLLIRLHATRDCTTVLLVDKPPGPLFNFKSEINELATLLNGSYSNSIILKGI
ncbi:hypothetical protein FKM82_025432 [Ascaphus truei]